MRLFSFGGIAFAAIATVACGRVLDPPEDDPAVVAPTHDASADGPGDAATSCGTSFTDDFEGAWTKVLWDDQLINGNGKIELATDDGNSGQQSVRFRASGVTDVANLVKRAAGSCTLRVRAFVKLGAGSSNVGLLSVGLDGGRSLHVRTVAAGSGALALTVSDAKVTATSKAVDQGKWVKIELQYVPTSGAASLAVDDQPKTIAIAPSPTSTVSIGIFGAAFLGVGDASEVYFDDVTIEN